MKIIDKRLHEISNLIDKYLTMINSNNRAELSTEILANIRNYCELVLYKIYDEENNKDLYQTQENLKKVRIFIKSFHPQFYRIHQLLDCSGHISFGIDHSEALMIKYVPMLISMKIFLIEHYNITTLEFIDKYPLNLDDSLIKFYRKIIFAINSIDGIKSQKTKELYFIRKKTLKYIDNQVFYEYTLDVSDDKPNKFNTVVAYSKLNIELIYDMSFYICRSTVSFLEAQIPINIIVDYDVFIRPCSFKTMLLLINEKLDIKSRTKVYLELMEAIKRRNCTLLDIIEDNISFTTKTDYYVKFINIIKNYISSSRMGVNLIRYLLLSMRYNVIKGQLNKKLYKNYTTVLNPFYDNLRIRSGSLGFEYNPIAFSPLIEKPTINELSRLFDLKEFIHELLYKKIEEYINCTNSLFVDCKSLGYKVEEMDMLVEKFNDNLYDYYQEYKIIKVYDKYTIKFYYESTLKVINYISKLSKICNVQLNTQVTADSNLSNDKLKIIEKSFLESSICIVTGAAGTGKTKLIHEFLKLNKDKKILCLATTNTAKNNIMGEYGSNVTYKNTSENWKLSNEYEFIVIDEAGFIPTKMICEILTINQNANFLIVGDPYQIESIEFGNWFKIILDIFKKSNFIYKLDVNHRAKTDELQKVWDSIRNLSEYGDNKILELLSTFEFAKPISKDVLSLNIGEVVLSLNYDGLYGINNMNRYLQCLNKNDGFIYQQNIYKVDDPVVFIVNDYDSFGLYNNTKGRIFRIVSNEVGFKFFIELEKNINLNVKVNREIEINSKNKNSIVIVSKDILTSDLYNDELTYRSKLPFQLSYSMSIHKAQGLEFDKVKIIITNDTEEYITKNIFYTAITRARNKLEIYWDPEVPNKLFNNLIEESQSTRNDLNIIYRLIGEKKILL